MKRTFVNASGSQVERNRRENIVNINDTEKEDAIKYAVVLTVTICTKLGISLEWLSEVIASTMIYNITYRVHQYMRGITNTTQLSSRILKIKANTQEFNIKGNKYVLTSEQMEMAWIEAYKSLGYEKTAEKDTTVLRKARAENIAKWHTIVCLMELFNARLKELQIGPDSWIQSKTQGNITQAKISTFGINPQYRHFLSGVSWDVGIRGTLSKFTSGVCQLALLSAQNPNDGVFARKNTIAVNRAFSFIPGINVISDFVARNNAVTNEPIITKMCHITSIHGDRHKRKASPPFCAIWKQCVTLLGPDKVDEETMMDVDNAKKQKTEGMPKYTFHDMEKVGFSNKNAVLLYRDSMSTILMPKGIDKVCARQIVFHAFFGTHGENTGILSYMTDQKMWMRREQIPRNFFKDLKTISEVSNIPGVEMRIYSRMILANQTKMLAQGGDVYGSLEVFSGYRQKRFADEHLKFIRKGNFGSGDIISGDLSSIIRHLDSVIDKLLREISSSKTERFGTTTWHEVRSATYERESDGSRVDSVPDEDEGNFWSNSS